MEGLFERLKERLPSEELILYSVYSPVYVQREALPANQIKVEEFEFVDTRVDMAEEESRKRFIDKVVRESLEMEVKGFYLLCLVARTDKGYILLWENPIVEELRADIEEALRRIEEG